MPENIAEWSQSEQKIAQAAFEKAYEREIAALMATVREKATEMTDIEQMWQLHDFLSAKRHDIEGKYDYRYSALIFTFARLVKEDWLQMQELQGLEADKLAKIKALMRI
jgi:hypothetical protein